MDENDIGQQWRGFRRPFQGNPQQGTLFDKRSVERAPITTPGSQRIDRRRAMVAAMPSGWAGPNLREHREVREKVEQRMPLEAMYGEDREGIAAGNIAARQAGKQIRAEMGKTLADETTVRPEHLEGLDRIDVGQKVHENGSVWPEMHPAAAAHYSQHRSANGPRIQARGPMPTEILVHEIGHHVSRAQQGNPPDRGTPIGGDLSVDLGEEGRADAFALEHLRTPEHGRTYAARHSNSEPFSGPASPYRAAREAAGQPLMEGVERPRDIRPVPEPGQLPRQEEFFTTDQANILAPYMGEDVGVNIYRPSPVLDRGNRPIGFEVRPGESRGHYEVEGGGFLDPRDTGYYWKRRGEGDERMMPHHLEVDGVTLETIDQEERR